MGDFNINSLSKQKAHEIFLTKHSLIDVAQASDLLKIPTRIDNRSANALDRALVHSSLKAELEMEIRVVPKTDHSKLILNCYTSLSTTKEFKKLIPHVSLMSKEPHRSLWLAQLNNMNLMDETFQPLVAWTAIKELSYQFATKLHIRHKNNIEAHISTLLKKADQAMLSVPIDHQKIIQIKHKVDQMMGAKKKLMLLKTKAYFHANKNTNNSAIIKWLKKKKIKTSIYGIISNGVVITEGKQIRYKYFKYLKKLAAFQDNCENSIKSFERLGPSSPNRFFISRCFQKLKSSDLAKLDKPIQEEELNNVLKAINIVSAPGPDGLSGLFYRLFEDIVKQPLLSFFNALHENDKIDGAFKFINQALVVPISKATVVPSVVDIEKLRPIALMNYDIKILSKILLNRIAPLLDKLIVKSSTAVRGRGIGLSLWLHYCVFKFKVKVGGDRPMLLRLDLQKAFCRVNTTYLAYLLGKYLGNNITSTLIRKVITIKQIAVATDGRSGDMSDLGGSILQGSPLSSDLFNIYINDFLFRLQNGIRGVRVASVKDRIKTTTYIDDISVFLADGRDLAEVIKIIEVFADVTGTIVNVDKSYLLDLTTGLNMNHPLFTGSSEAILGVHFSPFEQAEDYKDINIKLKEIKDLVANWSKLGLSWMDKVSLINTLVIPKIIYYLPYFVITLKWKKALNRVTQNFLFRRVKFLSGERTSYPSQQGGLGLLDIKALDLSVKSKAYTKYFLEPNATLHGIHNNINSIKDKAIRALYQAWSSLVMLQQRNIPINHKSVRQWLLEQNSQFGEYKHNRANVKLFRQLHFSFNLEDFRVKLELNLLSTGAFLARRNLLPNNAIFCSCNNQIIETMDHLFFHCLKFAQDAFPFFKVLAEVYAVKSLTVGLNIKKLFLLPKVSHKWVTVLLFSIWKTRCAVVFHNPGDSFEKTFHSLVYKESLIDFYSFSPCTFYKLWDIRLLSLNPLLKNLL